MSYERYGYNRRNRILIFFCYTVIQNWIVKAEFWKIFLLTICYLLWFSFTFPTTANVFVGIFVGVKKQPDCTTFCRIPRYSWWSLSSLKGAASKQAPTTAAKSTWRYTLGEWSWMPKKNEGSNQNEISQCWIFWVIWGLIYKTNQNNVIS